MFVYTCVCMLAWSVLLQVRVMRTPGWGGVGWGVISGGGGTMREACNECQLWSHASLALQFKEDRQGGTEESRNIAILLIRGKVYVSVCLCVHTLACVFLW